ncbi:MAG: 8-amino-7-oxononanoate synthase [Bacillota bacterium]
MRSWADELKEELEKLDAVSRRRRLVEVDGAKDPWLKIDGRSMLNLSSNNYLGLAGDERLKRAAIEAVEKYGAGATASRLVVGNHPAYREAESALVRWKGAGGGLIFNSGYTANTGIIQALAGRDTAVFSDKLNHASIIDGIILSRAENNRYRHNDLDHLEWLLKKTPPDRKKLIVTDAVFSMDGDVALLEGLVDLKDRYNAILMVDEAHSGGVIGSRGQGMAHHLGLQYKVDVQMGTFSKAMGSFGAYVVGGQWLIDYLVNKMRSFIFTTALPPAVLGAIEAAISIVSEDSSSRRALSDNSRYFRTALSRLGFDTCGSQSQIVPIVIGTDEKTVLFSRRLHEEGIATVAVRPPTVPENTARIRFSVTAVHRRQDLEWAVDRIAVVGRQMGVI